MTPSTPNPHFDLGSWWREALRPANVWMAALVAAGLLVIVGGVLLDAGRPTLQQCAVLARSDERLACFDELARREQSWPAKGAVLPHPERPRDER